MQTCNRCHAQSPDTAIYCENCHADLRDFSTTSAALKRLKNNPRVSQIRISTAGDACPVCREHQGTYPKDAVPLLPIEGCSHPHGCRCFYEPVLDELFP